MRQGRKKATFQKMVTNHGAENGDICLLEGEPWIQPSEMKAMQQQIVDSCCSTIYDEFIQCYAGYAVDEVNNLNTNVVNNNPNKVKPTIYANSPADKSCGWSNGKGSRFLMAKIAALKAGYSYAAAVAYAQAEYDKFLKKLLLTKLIIKIILEADSGKTIPNHGTKITETQEHIDDLTKGVGSARNVTVFPMSKYCEWKIVVVPPGGQLVLDFKGERGNCGNVTVYKEDSTTKDKTKIRVWNYNLPGSARYADKNAKRVFNGDENKSTTFYIHNDNGEFKLTASCNINRKLAQSETMHLFTLAFQWEAGMAYQPSSPRSINLLILYPTSTRSRSRCAIVRPVWERVMLKHSALRLILIQLIHCGQG
ncbi:MAG: hypothetical protein IPH84_00020 [Bacteroidales bacterium]|nr:hypothetical protein [Bacteroidales bacterium]